MPTTAMNEKNPSDRESKGLKTAIERGSRLPRRPENHKLLPQPLACHLKGLLNKLAKIPQNHESHPIIKDAAVYLLCTLDLIDKGAL